MRKRRRQNIHTEVDTEGSWAISYGDMVTLLLTFFIIFFAADKFRKDRNFVKMDLVSALTKVDRNVASVSPVQAEFPENKLSEKLQARVYQVGNRLLLEFPEVSFFRSGQTEVTTEGEKALGRFYSTYSPYVAHYQISIRAFTDSRKVKPLPSRRFKDNLELSALRSIAVMRHLQKNGMPLSVMKLSGYGEMLKTIKDLESLPVEKRKPTSLDDLARTVVLVIEPVEGV